jgi:hypothetical protein
MAEEDILGVGGDPACPRREISNSPSDPQVAFSHGSMTAKKSSIWGEGTESCVLQNTARAPAGM